LAAPSPLCDDDEAVFEMSTTPRSRPRELAASDGDVRLIDEHDRQIIMLQPAQARPRATRTDRDIRGPRAGWAWRTLAIALILLGALALIDAGVTLVWQEPLSALYARLRQDHLSGALAKVERAAPTPLERSALARLSDQSTRVAFLARELERRAGEGSAVGRIEIPRIGASFVVVKGTSTSDLESGPGIYPETSFPGIAGTTAIAGHRTTYLAPFRHIDALRPGSRILLDMPYARFTYTVLGTRVVAPTDVRAAVADVGYPRLVLSACTPLFSAAKRLLVFARLTSTLPVGAGRGSQALPGVPVTGGAPTAPVGGPAAGEAPVGGPAAGEAPVGHALEAPPLLGRGRSSTALPAMLKSAEPDLGSPLA
jgi:sortase A